MSLYTRTAIATAVLGGLAAAAIVLSPGSSDWEKMRTVMQKMRADRLSEHRVREAPYGETLDDMAWPHYLKATATIEALESAGLENAGHRAKAFAKGELSEDERHAFVADCSATLEHVRLGASSRNATAQIAWDDGLSARIFKQFYVRGISYAAVAKMQVLLEDGRPMEAVETMLDAQQFAADLMCTPQIIMEAMGCAYVVPDTLSQVLTGEHFGLLTPEAKAHWLKGLRRIAAGIPRESDSFRGDLVLSYASLYGPIRSGTFEASNFFGSGWREWRPSFVWRHELSRYVLESDEAARKLESAYMLAPHEVAPAAAAAGNQLATNTHRLTRQLAPKLGALAAMRVEALTRLAFLTHALSVEAGLKDPLPPSAHAAPVQVEHDGYRVRVWCERPHHDRARRVLEIRVGD